jgi:hypothetical protein
VAVELQFIKDFGARYANDPNLTGVVIGGLGTNPGFESYVAKTADDMTAIGDPDAATKWTASCAQIRAAFAAAFPNRAHIMAAGQPLPNGDNLLKSLVDSQMALDPNFGVMCCSLKKDSSTSYMPNALVDAWSPTHPCALQFVANTSDPRTGGTLAEVLPVGVALLHGRGDIEIYAADGDNPANAATIAATAAQLAK